MHFGSTHLGYFNPYLPMGYNTGVFSMGFQADGTMFAIDPSQAAALAVAP